jgi:ribosomal protein L11 methyltransferase
MELLEQAVESLVGGKFDALDVGTGSGILSIALAKSGARKVYAIDNDPTALKSARVNLAANEASGKVYLSGAGLGRLRGRFALVVANLTAETILEIAAELANNVAPGGFLILAGILRGKARAVVDHFTDRGFTLTRRKREKEWVALLLRRS